MCEQSMSFPVWAQLDIAETAKSDVSSEVIHSEFELEDSVFTDPCDKLVLDDSNVGETDDSVSKDNRVEINTKNKISTVGKLLESKVSVEVKDITGEVRMEGDHVPSYQEILTENFYLFSKYIIPEDFIEALVSKDILSLDDKEVITNPYTCQSRRQRANKLIEILMMRGEQGYTTFVDLLEYQYPHVYKQVTKKEPRTPPKGFHYNRISDKLRMINDLPNLAQHIKDQVNKNDDLCTQLEVLQQILEFSKEENVALEKEIEMLKNVKSDNENLKMKITNLENESHEHLLNNNKAMERTMQYIEARDEYQQKWQDLQVKYDELYKTSKLKIQVTKSQSVDIPKVPQRPPPPITPKPDLKGSTRTVQEVREKHVKERTEILQTELDDYRAQCEDLANKLDTSEQLINRLEVDKMSCEKSREKVVREMKTIEKQLKDANTKCDAYFNTIKKKNDEILELESQKTNEQQRYTDLSRQKNEIFNQNQELEKKFLQLQMEMERIKARHSGSSQCSGSDDEIAEAQLPNSPIRSTLDRHHKRRKNFKSSSSNADGDLENCDSKYYTLPPPTANDTAEDVFRREIVRFRYTERSKNYTERSKNSNISHDDSMKVNYGSEKRPENVNNRVDAYNPPMNCGLCMSKVFDEPVMVREPMVHPPDPDETNYDNVSTGSNDLRPRTPKTPTEEMANLKFLGHNSTAPVPSGGKVRHLPPKIPRVQSTDFDESSNTSSSTGTSSDNTNLDTDFSIHDIYMDALPRECVTVKRSGLLEKNMCRVYTVKQPVAEKIEIKGGNHTGIFITRVLKPGTDLIEGSEIKEIIYTPNDKAKPVSALLKGCMLDEAMKLLSEDYIRRKKEKEVKISLKQCRQEYDSVCKWMSDNNGTGDFFFIRCNIQNRSEDCGLKPGDIFCVRNTRHGDRQWAGYMVDKHTGVCQRTEMVIPNIQEAHLRRLPSLNRSYSECQQDEGEDTAVKSSTRKGAIKLRGQPYDRVLPVKASVKLPVNIVGPSFIVNAVLNLISKELSPTFNVEETDTSDNGGATPEQKPELYRHDVHYVRKTRMEKIACQKSLQKITIFIHITSEISPLQYRKLFGEGFKMEFSEDTVSSCSTLRQTLVDNGHYFEEIILPDISSKEALLKSFTLCVKSSQNRILWLNSTEMDEGVASKYSKYLGQECNLINIMTSLQRAHSLDQSVQ